VVNKIDKTLSYSDNSIATQLYDSLSTTTGYLFGSSLYTGGANYNEFRRLLIKAEVLNGFSDSRYMSQCAFTPDFLDTEDYTCLAPTNAAILAEMSRPGGSRIPETNAADGNKALKEYLKYYFIKTNVIWTTDNISSASYVTANGATLDVSVQNGVINITDKVGGTATTGNSDCVTNVMAKGGNIHQINSVLNFK